MVCHGEWAGEDRAGLAILALAIAEEQRVGGGVVMPQVARLPDETAGQSGAVLNGGTARDDEVVTNHAMADVYGIELVAVDRSVLQTPGALNLAIIADTHILDVTGIDDLYVMTDRAHVGCILFGIAGNDSLEVLDQLRAMAIETKHIGLVGGKAVVDRHLAATGLVQYRDLNIVSERRVPIYQDNIHVLYQRVVANTVVGDVILDVLDQAVVADLHVVQVGFSDTGMLTDATRQGKFLVERAQPDRPAELGL